MMQQKEIFKKIGGIIAELTEQYQYLSENPEQLNDLELELFSANSDFLAEHVKVLKKVNLSALAQKQMPLELPASTEKEESSARISVAANTPVIQRQEDAIRVPDSKEFVSVAPEENTTVLAMPNPVAKRVNFEPAPIIQSQPEVSSPKIEPEPVVEIIEPVQPSLEVSSVTEPLSNATKEPVKEEPGINEVRVSAPVVVAEEVPQKEIIEVEEVIPSRPQTINELISAQIKKSFSEEPQTNQRPVSDLKSAINLNDKLLFIKDLFNGYSLAYSEAIELLNRFESFDVAETFLKANYATKNNWAAKQSTVDKFYDFLHRRYTK